MNQPTSRAVNDRVVLTGVKAKPFGWPAASLDPGSGRHAHIGQDEPAGKERTPQN